MRIKQEYAWKEVLDDNGDIPIRNDRHGNHDGLVKNIDDDIRRQLGEKLGEMQVVVDGEGERRRDAFAKVVAKQEIREDRTKPAT